MENGIEDNISPIKQNEEMKCKKKYNFYRKPSIKKKAPEVKQTLTSFKRMLNANPLLKYELEGKDLPALSNGMRSENGCSKQLGKQSLEPTFNSRKYIQKTNSVNPPQCMITQPPKSGTSTSSIVSRNKPQLIAKSSSGNISKQSHINFNPSTSRFLCSTRLENSGTSNVKINKKEIKQDIKNQKKNSIQSNSVTDNKDKSVLSSVSTESRNQRKNKSIRRSLSAQHFDRKKGGSNARPSFSQQNLLTQSLLDISSLKPDNVQHAISPIAEGSQESIIIFKTPSAYERRSIAKFTPKSALSVRRSRLSTSLPSLNLLQKRLNDWLLKRGKSVSTFHHLKCFGVPENQQDSFNDENKENLEVNEAFDKGSYEELNIPKNDHHSSSSLKEENAEHIAKAALEDLHKLIQEGYSRPQCEAWLELIRQRYLQLEDEPQYWECRAALEQSRGNISNAVDCYKTAIVQGAEVQSVDESLDILLQKFSLLNITADHIESDKSSKDRARIIQDARNVFKSSIIQFAVQQRKLKKNSSEENKKKLLVTPVRRSTRLSRSTYTSTPSVKICSSLHELDPDREIMDFKTNRALL